MNVVDKVIQDNVDKVNEYLAADEFHRVKKLKFFTLEVIKNMAEEVCVEHLMDHIQEKLEVLDGCK